MRGVAVYIKLLSGRLFGADEGDFYLLAALRAGQAEGDGLPHDPFGDRRNDGVDVIQAAVQHVEPFDEAYEIRGRLVVDGFPVVWLGQGCGPLKYKVRPIIS